MLTTRNTPTRGPIGLALSKLAYHPAGPTILAVSLALISLPLVALTLPVYELMNAPPIGDLRSLSPTDPARWTAATSAVLFSALIGGSVGGWLIRHKRDLYWLALLLAWFCGIAGTTLLPALLGQHFGVNPICVDACGYSTTTDDPGSSVLAAGLFFAFAPMADRYAAGALAVGFVIWSQVFVRFGPPVPQRATSWREQGWQGSYPPSTPYQWSQRAVPEASDAPTSGPDPTPATPPTQPGDQGTRDPG